MDILDANATSLAAMLLPVGILGVWAYYKAGLINIKESLWISLGLFLGSFAGGELAVNISESLLAKLYAAILLYIAVSYFDIPRYFQKKKEPKPAVYPKDEKTFWAFILVGVGAGILRDFWQRRWNNHCSYVDRNFHYDAKVAAATSLAALQLPVGLPSVLIYAHDGHLNILYATLIAVGILAGAFFGSKLGVRLPSAIFKKVYAVFLLAVAVFMVYKYI